jgi:hypothetical protein
MGRGGTNLPLIRLDTLQTSSPYDAYSRVFPLGIA